MDSPLACQNDTGGPLTFWADLGILNYMKKLLTTGNPKTAKGEGAGYLTSILHLAPSTLSGFNTCPMASAGCKAACLNTAGRGGIIKRGETTNIIQKARIRKTLELFNNREAFLTQLVREVENTLRLAEKHGLTPVFRLNGTSDLRWEVMPVIRKGVEYPNIMTAFPTVQFYDYTKIANRRNLSANYSLTFSLSESNNADAQEALENGMNIAVVFRKVPESFMSLPVINGDLTDLRFLDPSGVVVGLKAKGKAKKDTTGFVRG